MALSAGRPSERKAAEAAAAPAAPAGAEDVARVNFVVPRELHTAFKVWAAQNGTTIKDELTQHMQAVTRPPR